ncbi:hypothetical protein ABPG74_006392 [Tetrahymena malaccensis]
MTENTQNNKAEFKQMELPSQNSQNSQQNKLPNYKSINPYEYNHQQVNNPFVASYVPENDHRLDVNQQQINQTRFEQEKAKFQKDLNGIKEYGANLYQETKLKAKDKYDQIIQANPVLQKVESKGKQIFDKANNIADQIKLEYDKLEEKYKEYMRQQNEKLNAWARTKLQIIIMDMITKSKDDIKEAVKDPYMFEWVKKIIDDIIDDNWPYIEQEILYRLRMVIDEPIIHKEEDPNSCCLIACFNYLPNKYLYERIPYNRSSWYQFRRLWFWFFMLFEIFPFYGVQSFFYFLVFLIIDKTDEWQLVRFIIVYKQLQFFSSGILGGFIGYIQYFLCTSLGKKTYLEQFKNCTDNGPGVNVNMYADIAGIFLQIIVAWIAYFLIPLSRSKGKNIEFRYNKQKLEQNNGKSEEDEKQCCCCVLDVSKGGRFYKFMIYDLVVFVIMVGVYLIFVFAVNKKNEWQIRQILFMSKTLYCLLNFPFLIFAFPVIPQIITASRKTGYDQYGVCVPKIVKYTSKEWDDIEQKYDQSRSRIVAQDEDGEEEQKILNNIKVEELYK